MANTLSTNQLLNEPRLSVSDVFFNHGGVVVGSKWWKSNEEFQEHLLSRAEDFVSANVLEPENITPMMLVDDFMNRL